MNVHAPNTQTPNSPVRRYGDQQWFDAIPGESLTIRVHSSEVDGKYTIMENIAEHGTATPMHTHVEDEVFHILEGEVLFSINGQVSLVAVGDVILISSGTPHAWRNNSGARSRMVTYFTPGGIETMFAKFAGLGVPQIIKIADEYGTQVVGPPIEI